MTTSRRKSPAKRIPVSKGMLIGYGRVSKDQQKTDLQMDALQAAKCEQIYVEKESRALKALDRPELANALRALRPGDTLVVWKLDRLGGNLVDLVTTVDGLHERGIHFRSLTEAIDTSTPTGRMFFQVIAVLAEYERNRLIERTKAGLEAARARGRIGGRKKVLTDRQVRQIRALLNDPEIRVIDVCDQFGVSRATLYRYVGTVAPLRALPRPAQKS